MNRFALVFLVAALVTPPAQAGAQTASPKPTLAPKAAKAGYGRSLSHSNSIHGPASNGPVSAAACNARAAAMPGSSGTLGPSGTSASQTLVAVPLGGTNIAATTREHQIAEACAHRRR